MDSLPASYPVAVPPDEYFDDPTVRVGPDDLVSAEEALAEPEPQPGHPRVETGVRVARGGSWISGVANCRSAARVRTIPLFRTSNSGFRLEKELNRP